uniref:Uncharacterized protein n=1 Tax=Siphoviridae sp. ctL0q1 TaxID=2825449 RepID=A0A8S5PIJ3_9CAUD|nr:MAG TPA: hypothetical protein [Siphoviridae sp. ctL0q1]
MLDEGGCTRQRDGFNSRPSFAKNKKTGGIII